MKVAVVILNYNGQEQLAQFLPGVIKYSPDPVEVVIADNGSTDESLDWLKDTYPNLAVIDLKENFGFAEGYNQALKQIEADYYVLLNSDVEVTPNWIEPIIGRMQSDETIAAAQPKILAQQAKDHFEYAGASGGWLDYLGYPFCRGRIFDLNEKDHGQYNEEANIFWASGAALFIRASLFHQIGGFDGSYFAHSEEIDLCWRLQRAGFVIKCFPQSVVYHVGGGTLNYQSPFKAFLNFRNSLYTILKNEPALKLVWLIPARLILDGVAGFLFISQGKFKHLGAILKAHFSFYGNIIQTLRNKRLYREKVNACRIKETNQLKGRYLGSIVVDYYLRKKRTFKDLPG